MAVVRGGIVYHVHADHLGTPRSITRGSTGAQVWRWDSEPFGSTYPTTFTGGFDYHLRFAGQYFDLWTGLHYNWHRYYDPVTGRYTQADPIGLAGGLARYTYVDGSPLNATDPAGLAPNYDERMIGGGAGGARAPLPARFGGGPYAPQTSNNYSVIVVDRAGNAIPLRPGEQITQSANGMYRQVRDSAGTPTGMRIDGGHNPRTHPDPRAQQPHAHVPGLTNADGTPWLPLYCAP